VISKAGGWRQIDGLLGIFHPVLPFGLWLTLRMAPSSSLVGSLSFFIVGGFAVLLHRWWVRCARHFFPLQSTWKSL